MIPDGRLLPAAAVSTFSLVAIIVYCRAKLRPPTHRAACKEILGHWLHRFIPGDFAFRVLLCDKARVNFVSRVVAPAGPDVNVRCIGRALDFGDVVHQPEGVALGGLVGDLGSPPPPPLIDVMVKLSNQPGSSVWLLSQLLLATGLAMGSNYDDCSRSSLGVAG